MRFYGITCALFLSYLSIVAGEWADCGYEPWENTECVRLTECQGVVEHIKKLYATDQIAHRIFLGQPLINMTCGFDGYSPKVCCSYEDQDPTPKKVDNEVPRKPSRRNAKSGTTGTPTCGNILWTKSLTPDGAPTEIGEFPWSALLEYNDTEGATRLGCGGVLISNHYVLTAAHCVNENLTGIRLGEYDVNTATDCKYRNNDPRDLHYCNDHTVIVAHDKAIVHPGYNSKKTAYNTRINDIALLHFKYPVSFNDYIKPICLPSDPGTAPDDAKFLTAGWGATLVKDYLSSPTKRNSRLAVVPKNHCEGIYRMNLNNDFICAQAKSNRSVCVGDSGGPLMTFDQQSRMVVAGIFTPASMKFCRYTGIPGIYTDVRKYKNWILKNMK